VLRAGGASPETAAGRGASAGEILERREEQGKKLAFDIALSGSV